MIVYSSMANGRSQRVDSASTGADAKGEFTFDLPLKPFVDGGWYWYDVVAGDETVGRRGGRGTAEVPDDRLEHGTVDIAITTMNRPDFCAKLLAQIGDDRGLRALLDEVLVMEQGTQKVRRLRVLRAPQEALGDKLRVHRAGQPRRLGRLRPRPATSRSARAPRRTR